MLTSALRLLLARKIKPFTFTPAESINYTPRMNSVGLYIHIPFCKKICNFCPYNKIVYNQPIAEAYMEALMRELSHVKNQLPGYEISSIYVGGGTPSLMKEELGGIFDYIRQNFNLTGEIALELHPSDTDTATLDYLKNIGVTMVSVGIQSFDKEILKTLTRYDVTYDPHEVVRRVMNGGFKSVDVDLLFGIKDVTLENHEKDFLTAISYGVDQISTYPLIPFTFTALGKKHFDAKDVLSDKKTRKETLEAFNEIAKMEGYNRSSIWSFTKKGSIRYSSVTRSSFLGVGASATSLIGGSFAINTFSVEDYIEETKKRIPTALHYPMDERVEHMFWMFWQSYNTIIRSDEFTAIFGKDLKKEFSLELKAGVLLGLLKPDGDNFRLTPRGSYLFHLIEQEYTHTYLNKAWGTCMTEAWPKELVLA